MMERIIEKLNVELTRQQMKSEVMIYAKQGDVDSTEIVISLYHSGGVLKVAPSSKARVRFLKPDNTAVYNDASIDEDGKVHIILTAQMLAVKGIARADVEISEASKILSSFIFYIDINEKAVSDGTIESSDEFSALQQMISDIGGFNAALDEANDATDRANAAAERAESLDILKLQEDMSELQKEMQTIGLKLYPVGSIYLSISPTDPKTIFGGTWVRFANGRTLVGVDTLQTEFNTVEKTGGSKTHKLTVNEMPSHNHAMIDSAGNKEFGTTINQESTASRLIYAKSYSVVSSPDKMQKSGGDQAHNNLQPYITVYMWKRTA